MESNDHLLGDHQTNVEFKGLELLDLSQSVQDLTSPLTELTEYEIETEIGVSLRVYAPTNNPERRTPIVTYHDIGTNHNSFLGFFNYPEMRVLMQNFCVYHICAPGHHDSADSAGINVYPSMDELADMLGIVIRHFNIDFFVGFGMGAGANILARFALRHPMLVHGLFLINPSDTTHGYYQWMRLKWSDLPQLTKGIHTDNLLYFLESHWFGANQCQNPDLAEMYEQHLRCLNPINVAGYINSYIDRTDLCLVRDLTTPMDQQMHCIKTDCCLVSGEHSPDLVRAMCEMNGRMDPQRTQYLMIPDSNGMVMEENPERLVYNFLNFLRTISLVIKISPDRLKDLTLEHQKQMAEVNSNDAGILRIQDEELGPNLDANTLELSNLRLAELEC